MSEPTIRTTRAIAISPRKAPSRGVTEILSYGFRGLAVCGGMTLLETVSERVARLPPERQEEVLDFVEFLSLKNAESGHDAALDAVLQRRIAEIENGRVQGLSAEQVVREMRAKYG